MERDEDEIPTQATPLDILEDIRLIKNIKESVEIFHRELVEPDLTYQDGTGTVGYRDISIRQMRQRRKLQTKTIIDEWQRTNIYSEMIDLMQVVFSLMSVIIYVWNTYITYEQLWMRTVEYVCATVFIFDYIQKLYLAKNKIRFIFSFFGMVDMITIVPVFINANHYLSFFRIARIARILRLLKPNKTLNVVITAIQRQTFILLFTVFCLIFITTGLINMVEKTPAGEPLPFHTALYCVVVTIATVGYGDITPKTEIGRAVMMALMVSGAILIPVQLNRLGDLLAAHSIYDEEYKKRSPHVIVSGHVTATILTDFLSDFYFEDRGHYHWKVVVMVPGKPDPAIIAITRSPLWEKRLVYLRGTIMLNVDLRRAAAEKAKACFIFGDVHTDDQRNSDHETMLKTLSVRKFNSKLPVFVVLNGTESKLNIEKIGVKQSFSVSELKQKLLAKSVMYPGLGVFVTNLVKHKNYGKASMLSTKTMTWKEEYSHGRSISVYSVQLPSSMSGKSFADAALTIYTRFQAILIGVVVGDSEQSYLSLNPGSGYTLEGGEIAFVMTESESHAFEIATYSEHSSNVMTGTQLKRLDNTVYVATKKDNFFNNSFLRNSREDLGLLEEFYLTQNTEFDKIEGPPSDHIIIATKKMNIYHLIKALRAKAIPIEKVRDIVILTTAQVSEDEWSAISIFPRISVLPGSALNWNDMHRANVDSAHSVLILADTAIDPNEEEFQFDVDAILAYLTLEANMKNNKLNVIVELVMDTDVRFISDPEFKNIPNDLLPACTSGRAFFTSLFSSLAVQAYFNPYIIKIVHMWATIGLKAESGEIQSDLTSIELPMEFDGRIFFEMFYNLLQNGVLALGLYRMKKDDLSYVYTCPLPNTVLRSTDKVFILNPVR